MSRVTLAKSLPPTRSWLYFEFLEKAVGSLLPFLIHYSMLSTSPRELGIAATLYAGTWRVAGDGLVRVGALANRVGSRKRSL